MESATTEQPVEPIGVGFKLEPLPEAFFDAFESWLKNWARGFERNEAATKTKKTRHCPQR